MKQEPVRNIKRSSANFLGAFGYLFCFLQWFWAIMLYFSMVQSVALFVAPSAHQQSQLSAGLRLALPSSFELIVVAIIIAIMIALTIYLLIKLPMNIVKTGNKIVHKTAETMTPIVMRAQHKKDTKKLHARLTSKLILVIKLLLVVIPIALTAASGLLEKQSIDYSIALVVGCGLAGFSMAFFTVQYALAGLLRVKMSELW